MLASLLNNPDKFRSNSRIEEQATVANWPCKTKPICIHSLKVKYWILINSTQKLVCVLRSNQLYGPNSVSRKSKYLKGPFDIFIDIYCIVYALTFFVLVRGLVVVSHFEIVVVVRLLVGVYFSVINFKNIVSIIFCIQQCQHW